MEDLTYNQRYYRSNRERELARSKKYAADNPKKRKKNNAKRYLPKRKEVTAEATRRWAHANPEAYALTRIRARLKHRFGISIEDYRALLVAQDHRCAICKIDKPAKKKTGPKTDRWPSVTILNEEFGWDVDHCHKTGKVRGLLCHHCNTGLGHFKDDPALLKTAIAYLCS